MLTCRALAELIVCSSISMNGAPVIPLDFDLRSVAGSYQEPLVEPAILYHYIPAPRPAHKSFIFADRRWEQTLDERRQFNTGFKLYPGRVRFRFRFDGSGIQSL